MKISLIFNAAVQYISDAVARIFAPNDDAYPLIGVQPFEGEPYHPKSQADW